jgi:cytochrome c biogenesis protein
LKDNKGSNIFLEFFSSTQLTIIILILLAIGSIIGTVVVQKGTEEANHIPKIYSPTTIKVFEKLGFFDMYHSPMYVGLLCVLVINLLVCSYVRIRRDIYYQKFSNKNFFPSNWDRLKYATSSKIQHSKNIKTYIERTLENEKFKFIKINSSKWIAQKGEWGRFGFYIAHLGILIILLGGMVSSLFSVEGFLWLLPGEEVDTFVSNQGEKVDLGFRLKCNDFQIKQYSNGMIKEYESKLSVKKALKDEYSFSLIVNRPLSENGFRLYQASYQQVGIQSVKLSIFFKNGKKQKITLKIPGEASFKTFDGRSFTLKAMRFEPDFLIDSHGNITSRTNQQSANRWP